ncbi:MAG: hypothetical protein KF900_13020 [Bacteroidetes bacterium]|nr:hypothetical protein [Bacteroidota bacterium]
MKSNIYKHQQTNKQNVWKKSLSLLLSGMVMLVAMSCQKTKDSVNEFTEFDVEYSSNISIPSFGTGSATADTIVAVDTTMTITTPEIPTQMTSKTSAAKTALNLIDEIKLTRFNISTLGSNLNFIKSLTIYIKTDGADVEVANVADIPENATSVSAHLSDVNIKDPMIKDKVQFKVIAAFKLVPDSTQTSLKLDQTVHVKGKKLQ